MKDNFTASLALVLISEGGFVNDPHDPGGATNKGVTQKEYDQFRAEENLPTRSVEVINSVEVGMIYRHDYWGVCHCDDLPIGVDYCVFDFGVNSGPGRAIRALQTAVEVKVDGWFGPKTLEAVNAKHPDEIIELICAGRLGYLQRLPTWKFYGDGWTHRVNSVEISALRMVG